MEAEILLHPWIAAGVVLASLVLSAFFSGGETALTAASKARMAALESAGDGRAGIVLRLMQSREKMIGAMLIGNTIVNIGVVSVITSILVPRFGMAGILYATLGMAALIVVFAEVLPKTAAIAQPDRMALLVARPASWFVALFGPLTTGLDAFARRVLRIVGANVEAGQPVLSGREELRGAVAMLHREGGVVKDDRDMLGGILDLKELEVSDVMIHRTKMRIIDADLPPEEIVREVLASPYTRMPLWRESPENIVGVLHAKDILRALDAAGGDPSKLKVADIMLEPWFVPATNTLHDQLKAFLTKKTHFALVVDEYGLVMGLVTLEDILEEIVGDIRDEHDLAIQGVRPQADGSVLAEGSVPIRDLNRALDWHLPDDEATTVAGLVIHEAQTIPEAGQIFTFHGFRFQVLRKSRNRITQIRIAPLAARKPDAA